MHTLYYRKGNLMRGLPVKRFQEFGEAVLEDSAWLETHGTKSGNDGFFGKDSDALARAVQAKLGIVVDGVVGPGTWSSIFLHLHLQDPTQPKVYERDGVKVIDGRLVWEPVKKYSGVRRPWAGDGRIRGVMMHQTGCWMPESPSTWNKINCHCGITRAGVVILMFDFDMLIWHGNGLTRPTIGIEIAGLFRGVEDDPRSYWPRSAKTHQLTDDQVKAAGVLFKILQESFEANGGKWEVLYCHRQSSDMRMSDPGESIYKRIVKPWINELSLSDGGEGYITGSGYPIPSQWNPAYAATFWKK